jgi:ParB family chromosome partitioning protein
MTMQDIPLSKLRISPENMRKAKDGTNIESLASTIMHQGLLQNLVVVDAGKGRFEVVAGERRFLALKHLASKKSLPASHPIPCRVVPRERAKEASLVENTHRVSHHPADEFEAIRSIVEQEPNASVEEVAARLGMTVRLVKQRWRLAKVHPELFQAYRDGQMSLDQLMAFTVSDDQERQLRNWVDHPYGRHPDSIKRRLTQGSVEQEDRRAVLVGLEAYEKAGGRVVRDLFDDEVWLLDVDLLEKLVSDRLAAEREKVQAEGWGWVEVVSVMGWHVTAGMSRVYPDAAPEGVEDELEALYAKWQEMATEHGEQPEDPAVAASMAATLAEIGRLEQDGGRYTPEDVSRAGCFVYLDNDGEVEVDRGWVRPQPKEPAAPPVADDTRPGAGGEPDTGADEAKDGGPAAPGKPQAPAQVPAAPAAEPEEEDEPLKPLPWELAQELTAHRTMALQLMLARSPKVALVAVVHALTQEALGLHGENGNCVKVSVTNPYLGNIVSTIGDTAACKGMREEQEMWGERLTADPKDRWHQLMEWSVADLLDLLAFCAARGVNAVRGRWDNPKSGRLEHADALAQAVGLDMADWWEPTPENYLNRVTKAHIMQAVTEARGKAEASALEGMKKAPMVAVADRQLRGTRWTPSVMGLQVVDKGVAHPNPAPTAEDGEREAA